MRVVIRLFDKAELTIVIDGYNAPLTAGNFVDLVQKGFYDKLPIDRADGFVVQAGDPDGPDGPVLLMQRSIMKLQSSVSQHVCSFLINSQPRGILWQDR